ncbi:MAG: hypothetical protein ACYDBJ_27855 [Aggregatilineales bacterium]
MQNPTVDFDINLFKQRLNETILWCRYKIAQSPTHTSEILWSLADRSATPSIGKQVLSFYIPNQRLAIVNTIFARRTQLIATLLPQPDVVLDDTLMDGRLVAFFIDHTLFDGAAESESKGFFDVNNVPACDAWVYFYNKDGRTHILSWVPPEYRHDAEEGISVNPEQCLHWLDEDDPMQWIPDCCKIPYIAQLKSAGFV